jgi:hypothetical protein
MILSNILLATLTPYVIEVVGIISVGSIITDLLQIRFSMFSRYWRKNGSIMGQCISFKKAYDSVKREVLYNILLEFAIPRKLVRLIIMCLNETCSKVIVGKLCLIISYSEWVETRRCSVTTAFKFFFRICHQGSPRKSSWFGIEWDTSTVGLF